MFISFVHFHWLSGSLSCVRVCAGVVRKKRKVYFVSTYTCLLGLASTAMPPNVRREREVRPLFILGFSMLRYFLFSVISFFYLYSFSISLFLFLLGGWSFMLVRIRQEGWFYKVYYKNKRHIVQYGEIIMFQDYDR